MRSTKSMVPHFLCVLSRLSPSGSGRRTQQGLEEILNLSGACRCLFPARECYNASVLLQALEGIDGEVMTH